METLSPKAGGVSAAAPANAGLVAGSTVAGTDTFGGELDEICSFARPLKEAELAFYYRALSKTAALGPITPEEDAAWQELLAKGEALREQQGEGGGGGMMRLLGATSTCITNVPVFITNIVATLDTNQGGTVVTFDIQGGTNGLLYDIFTTTNLLGTNLANAQWVWLERGPTCNTYRYTNQQGARAFYVVGTQMDTDGDGKTDAFEQLVAKSDPLVGENRVQTENAITGTTNWMLFNPVSITYSHGWPTNDADSIPEIEGFASATSVNVSIAVDLYVDVRNTTTNFTLEVFRLGWYGGQGGRRMNWNDNGNRTNSIVLMMPQATRAVHDWDKWFVRLPESARVQQQLAEQLHADHSIELGERCLRGQADHGDERDAPDHGQTELHHLCRARGRALLGSPVPSQRHDVAGLQSLGWQFDLSLPGSCGVLRRRG
jgi:hypothetical protein